MSRQGLHSDRFSLLLEGDGFGEAPSAIAFGTGNLLNVGKEKTAERTFEVLKELSKKIRIKYHVI